MSKRLRGALALLAGTALLAQPVAAGGAAALSEGKGSDALPSAIGYAPRDDVERGIWLEMEEQERELKRSRFVVQDPALNAYVRGVLCKTVGQDRCQASRIYIMRTPYFNASMAPNGMMQVWTGLLLRTRNEAQLAAVLGHEFAHFEKQHSLAAFKDMKARVDAAAWLSFLPYGVGLIAQVGILGGAFSFSREKEIEADRISVEEMARAGYSPAQAPAIWTQIGAEMDETARLRLTKSRKDRNGGFFATHPRTTDRVNALQAQASALATRGAAGALEGDAEYRDALRSWWPELIDDQIKLNDFGGTEFLLTELAADGWTADLLYARGELYRSRGKDGDFARAAEFYQQAIAIPGAQPVAWRGLGFARLRLGQNAEAAVALREYLTRSPQAKDAAMIQSMIEGNQI